MKWTGAPIALAGIWTLAACGSPAPGRVSLPIAPSPATSTATPQAPLPAPSPAGTAGFTLSGVVFEAAGQGRRSIQGTIDYAVDSPPNGVTEGHLTLDKDGRYVISSLPPQRPVKLTAWSYGSSGFRAQQCAVNTIMVADAVMDIELVAPGPPGVTQASPMLSGVVFEKTADGRRPVAGAWVTYYGLRGTRPDVYTETDANGRYDFCRIPSGPGRLGASLDCFNDAVQTVPVDVRGDAVVDVDLTSWLTEPLCQGQRRLH